MTEAIEQMEEEIYLQMRSDFVYFWCKEYGLPDIIAFYLDRKLIKDGDGLLKLPRKGLDKRVLSGGEMFLLMGALQQYACHRDTVDDIIHERAAAKREEMMDKAKKAIQTSRPEEKEMNKRMAVKILQCPSISDHIRKQNRKKQEERAVQAQYEEQQGEMSLIEKIMMRRQKLGIETRSISAPASDFNQFLSNKRHTSPSAKSTPGRIIHPPKSINHRGMKISSRHNQVAALTPVETMPNEVMYLENDEEDTLGDNNNNKGKRKHRKKKDKHSSGEAATVIVVCETQENLSPHRRSRERSFTNPEKMKTSKHKRPTSRTKSKE